jgi:hypothetical protein
VSVTEINASYMCPGFYPLAARDLAHAASLFAIWKARRLFGPRASCAQAILQEVVAGGGRFEVRMFSHIGALGETYRFTVISVDS